MPPKLQHEIKRKAPYTQRHIPVPPPPTRRLRSFYPERKACETANNIDFIAMREVEAELNQELDAQVVGPGVDTKQDAPPSEPGPACSAAGNGGRAAAPRVIDRRVITPDPIESLPGSSHTHEITTSDDECEESFGDHSGSDSETESDLETVQPEEIMEQMLLIYSREDAAVRDLVKDSSDITSFKWSSDPTTFVGQREVFTGQEGPTFATAEMSPLPIFKKIWDHEIISSIVRETNKHANRVRSANPEKLNGWKDATETDMWIFFAIVMLQGLVPVPVEKEYWLSCLPELKIGNFKYLMPYRKFTLIKKSLRFANNEVTTPRQQTIDNKKLANIKPIIDHLNTKFSTLYLPGQNILIDESLLLWKERLSFAQLIANKVARVGIQSYQVCDSRTGYLWQIKMYTGKEDHMGLENLLDVSREATSQIVYELIRPLLNKGHTLVMDNFHNSPLLSRMLKRQKTDTMGTLGLNREFVPEHIRNMTKSNMRVGEVACCHTHDLTILNWRDAGFVPMISSYHKVEVGGNEKRGQYKPQVVLDYNENIGGVDELEQMLLAFPVERVRNKVWHIKLFRRLLNVSIYNAYVIFSHGKQGQTQRNFRMELVKEILSTFKHMKPQKPRKIIHKPVLDHFPVRYVGCCRRCKNCSSRSKFMCRPCDVFLCINNCFNDYHASL